MRDHITPSDGKHANLPLHQVILYTNVYEGVEQALGIAYRNSLSCYPAFLTALAFRAGACPERIAQERPTN